MKTKPLVLSDIRSRAGSFVAEWRDAEGYERGEAQSFVRDLLQVFGITRSAAAVYEKRAQRRSEEHTSELQSRGHLVCRLLLEKKNLFIALFSGIVAVFIHYPIMVL